MAVPESEFEYRIIREEIRSEHGLISNRLTWYVTSQSFLVTAFVISNGNGFQGFRWLPIVLLPGAGFILSVLIWPSIAGACETIKLWHRKQADFFKREPAFESAFHLQRKNWVEKRGLLFPKILPVVFCVIWLLVLSAGFFARR